MPWLYGDRKNNIVLKLTLFAAVGLFTALIPASTAFADTEVGALICGDDLLGAEISIVQPLNDSVVSEREIVFSGSVVNATQIEVRVDDEYSNTIALGSNETVFQTDVNLSAGTHTITMIANAICGGLPASKSVVLTYQPAVEPSNGGTTPTIVDSSQQQAGGVLVSQKPIESKGSPLNIEQVPLIGAAVSVLRDIASRIDLISTVTNGKAPLAIGIVRVAVVIAALIVIVFADLLAPLFAGSPLASPSRSHRSPLYRGLIIRIVAIIALLLVCFL